MQGTELIQSFLLTDKHWLSLYDTTNDGSGHKYVTENNAGSHVYEDMTSYTHWGKATKAGKPCTIMKNSWEWESDDCNHTHACTCQYY